MKRKGFVIVVCLVLMLFGFSTAMAEDTETVTTITCTPGSMLAEDETLNQICETAAIRIHSLPEGYGALVLSLNDVDALTNLFRMDEEGFYLQSDLFGKTPLYFNWDDLVELFMEQMQNNPEMEAFNMMIGDELFETMLDGSMTEEEYEEHAFEMMGMDKELLEFISEIVDSETIETGTFTLDGSDIANQKAVTVLTKEDLIRAIELPMVRQQMANQILIASPDLTEEEVNEEVDKALVEIKQVIDEGNLTIITTVYTMDDAFVAMEFDASGTMEDYDGSVSNGGFSVTVTKTTIDQAEFYQLAVRLFQGEEEFLNQYGSLYLEEDFASGKYMINSVDGEPLMSATFSCDITQPDHTVGEFTATMYDATSGKENSVLVVFDQAKNGNITDTSIELFVGGRVDEIKAAFTESSVISLNFHTVKQPDSGFFTALQNATPETAVQLIQMTEEELNDYMSGMEQNFMMALITVIDNLPPDLSEALMQGMNSF